MHCPDRVLAGSDNVLLRAIVGNIRTRPRAHDFPRRRVCCGCTYFLSPVSVSEFAPATFKNDSADDAAIARIIYVMRNRRVLVNGREFCKIACRRLKKKRIIIKFNEKCFILIFSY